MDPSWLEFLKGTPTITIVVIAGLAIWGWSWAMKKFQGAIAAGFTNSVHPFQAELAGQREELSRQRAEIAELKAEVKGLRAAAENHGGRLSAAETAVTSLVTEVHGPLAIHAMRERVERKKAEVAARRGGENE